MILVEEQENLTKKKAIQKIVSDIRSLGRGGTAGRNYFKYVVVSDDNKNVEIWTVDARYDPKEPIGRRVQTRFSVKDKNTRNKPVYYDWTFWGGRYGEDWFTDMKRFLEREIGKSFSF